MELSKKVLKKLNCLTPEDYRLIEFEEDVYSLYKLFDIFIHIPKKGVTKHLDKHSLSSCYQILQLFFQRLNCKRDCKTRVNTYFCNLRKFI